MKYRPGTAPTYGDLFLPKPEKLVCTACGKSLGRAGAKVVHCIGKVGWEGSLHLRCAPSGWDASLGACPECREDGYPTDGGPPGWRGCSQCDHIDGVDIDEAEEEWPDRCAWCGGRVLQEEPRIVETTRGYGKCYHNSEVSPPCGRIDNCPRCGEMIWRGDPIVRGMHERCAQELKKAGLARSSENKPKADRSPN